MKLEGKRALITGGGRGIGLALAKELSGRGVSLILCGRDAATLSDAARTLGVDVRTLPLDVSDPGAAKLAAETCEAVGGLDMLINNAAIQINGVWLDSDPDEVLRDIDLEVATNLIGPLRLTAALLPILARGQDSTVVNITSGLAVAPKASAPVYCASKAAMRSATRALRYQMEDNSVAIRFVDAILPLVDTDMTAGRGKDKATTASVAAEVVRGLEGNLSEIWVGKARLMPLLMRLRPSMVYRMLR